MTSEEQARRRKLLRNTCTLRLFTWTTITITIYTITVNAGALSISIQKRSSPLFDVALHVVFVTVSDDGNVADRSMSTFTGTLPAANGNFIASKVSDPTPRGNGQVLDCEASPSHFSSWPMAPFITRSNVAPVTASSSCPVPVMVVFFPSVKLDGEPM